MKENIHLNHTSKMRSFLLTIFMSHTVFAEIKSFRDESGCRILLQWTYSKYHNNHAADQIKESTQTGLKTSTKKDQWELVPTGCSLGSGTQSYGSGDSDSELYKCTAEKNPARTFHLKRGDPTGCPGGVTAYTAEETHCGPSDSKFFCEVSFSCDKRDELMKTLKDKGVYRCESKDDGHSKIRLQVSVRPVHQSQGYKYKTLTIALSCCGVIVMLGLAGFCLQKRFRRSRSTKPDKEEPANKEELANKEVHEYDEIPGRPLPSAPQTAVQTIYSAATFPNTEDSAGPGRIYTGTAPTTATATTTTSAYSNVTRRTSDNTELPPKGLTTATAADDKPTVSSQL